MPRKTSETYIETLGRFDIPIEAQANIETFKEYLVDELGITNPAFQESLWAEVPLTATMEEYGIRAVPVTYPWGVEVRYGIQGMPGLWGWESVRTIMEEEEW